MRGMASERGDAVLAGTDVLAANQFDKEKMEHVFSIAEEMKEMVAKEGSSDELRGKLLGTCFAEASVHTKLSFEAAMLRLGGQVVGIPANMPSGKRREDLEDIVKTLDRLTDVLVVRHHDNDAGVRAAAAADVPVISAGDGKEDPSHALADIFSMHAAKGKIDGLTITMVGDFRYGRTVHSLGEMLSNFQINLNFVSTPPLSIPVSLRDILRHSPNVTLNEYTLGEIGYVLPMTDVLYLTRVQRERFPSDTAFVKEKGSYQVNTEYLDKNKCKEDLLVLNALPRVPELDRSFDSDPRAGYFDQIAHGMYARMALLAEVLRK